MATNSSIFSGSTNAKYQVLHLVFNQVSQDVANNRTLFSYEAYIQGTGGGSGSTTAGSYSITGATTTSASGQSWSWNTTTKQTIATGSFYVNHNSDGTLATQTLNISASFKTTSATLTSSTSVSLAVPTIPRASQPSLNVSTQALGSAITISTNRASSSFTHTLTYAVGNQSGTIATGVTTSQAWTLPLGLASAIPNATSGTGTITCKTFNGSTEIGSKSVSFTATVPNNPTFQPTATINSVVEDGDVPPSISEFVQSKTKFNIVSSGTGKYSAKISSYQITVDGVNYYGSSVITGFINTSGNRTITLKVTDTRGYSTTVSTTRNVVAYSPPTITTFRVYRSTSVQNMAHIEFGGTFTELVGNTRYFQVSSKSSEPNAQFVEETSSDYVGYFPAEFWIGQGMTALYNLSYTLRFTVQDSFSSVVRTIDLATAFKLMNFNASGKGMAIGKVSESDSFEVGMPANFNQLATFQGGIKTIEINGKDMNTVTETGFYCGYNMTNSAIQTISTFIVIKYSPDWIDQIQIITSATPQMYIRSRHSGTTWGSWTAISNSASSSRKIKKDIENTNHKENFNVFKGLKVYDYNLKDESDEKKTREKDHIGLITDEVPDFLTDKDQSYIKLYDLLSLTVSTLQTTIKKVETLELKVKDLEN